MNQKDIDHNNINQCEEFCIIWRKKRQNKSSIQSVLDNKTSALNQMQTFFQEQRKGWGKNDNV